MKVAGGDRLAGGASQAGWRAGARRAERITAGQVGVSLMRLNHAAQDALDYKYRRMARAAPESDVSHRGESLQGGVYGIQ